MHYGYTKFWTMNSKLCWFSFHETEFWTERSYFNNEQKSKNNSKIRGNKILRNPSRQIPKWEILEKKNQNFLGKIYAHKEKKKEHNKQTKNKAQNFLQSIQTKSKQPSLTW